MQLIIPRELQHALKPLPVYGTTHADHSPAEVPCTPVLSEAQVRGDDEIETGNLIVQEPGSLEPGARSPEPTRITT